MNFLNAKLEAMGEETGVPGLVMAIDTGHQCTLTGVGRMFEDFLQSGKVTEYTGFDQEPAKFYDKKNYHTAECRIMQFDESFYKMPYDCRSCN